MERIKKWLHDQNIVVFMLCINLIVVILVALFGCYIFYVHRTTGYQDFCASNRVHLSRFFEQHESNMEIIHSIEQQLGIASDLSFYKLQEQPVKAKKLKERLWQHKEVNGFLSDIVYVNLRDDYLISSSTSYEKERFFRTGLLLEKIDSKQLETLLFERKTKLNVIPEQMGSGSVLATATNHSGSVVGYLLPVMSGYDSSLLFVTRGSYYDGLLACTETEPRVNCLIYEGKIIAQRGDLSVSSEALERLVADMEDGQREVELSGEQCLLTFQKGTSGISYCTIQPMSVFYNKSAVTHMWIWGISILCGLLSISLIVLMSRKIIVKVRTINALLDVKDSDYNLSSIERGIYRILAKDTSNTQEVLLQKKTTFLKKFIRNEFDDSQDMHLAAREAQIDPEYASFQVLLMRGCQDVFSDMLQELAKNDTVDGYGMAMLHNNQYMIVIFAADTKAISPVVDSIFALGESRREFILATSKIHRCYEEAPEAYLEANASLNGFLLIDNQKIICYDDILDESRMVDIPPIYLQNLKYAVLRQEKPAVKTAILEIGSCIKARHYTLVAVQLLYVDIIRSLTKEYCNEEEIFSQVFDVFLLSKCVTIQDFCELLSDVCLRLIDQQKENRSENAEALVKAVAYVEENYGDSNLSVSVLADHLNLSQAALTAMFKQSMRMNPSDYLRMIRMEKAKKLLSDTDMLVKDIASAVGYDDSRVFVKRFKSNVGMTPVEYRKQS